MGSAERQTPSPDTPLPPDQEVRLSEDYEPASIDLLAGLFCGC